MIMQRIGKNCLPLLLLCGGLAACNDSSGSEPSLASLNIADKADVRAAVPAIGKGKSVLVVRVLSDGGSCQGSGTVRITPVAGGKLEPNRSINVGHANFAYTKDGFASFGRVLGSMATLDFSGAQKESMVMHMKTSFVSVPPGDYVVTHVECAQGPESKRWIGGGNWTGWAPVGLGASTPVNGDNYISVPQGKIVDAGFLDLTTTDAGGLFSSARGRIVGRELGENAKAGLKKEFPEIYTNAAFSRFSSWPGSFSSDGR
jgi:hypothetical protein